MTAEKQKTEHALLTERGISPQDALELINLASDKPMPSSTVYSQQIGIISNSICTEIHCLLKVATTDAIQRFISDFGDEPILDPITGDQTLKLIGLYPGNNEFVFEFTEYTMGLEDCYLTLEQLPINTQIDLLKALERSL